MCKLLLCLVMCSALLLPSQARGSEYDSLLSAIKRTTIDVKSARNAEGVMIEDNLMSVFIESGTIALFTPVQGETIGAIFIGKATMSFTPNSIVEQNNLRRFYPDGVFQREVKQILFVFTNNEVRNIIEELPKVLLNSDFTKVNEDLMKAVLQNEDLEVDESMASHFLNGDCNTGLYMAALDNDGLTIIMNNDPTRMEPYSLVVEKAPGTNTQYTSVSSCLAPGGAVKMSEYGAIGVDLVEIEQHNLDVTINRAMFMNCKDRVDLQVLADSVRWLPIFIDSRMRIGAIKEFNGQTLNFFQAKDSWNVWVKLPHTLKKGDKLRLEIDYGGEVIKRYGDYTVLSSSISWYPAYSGKQKSFFDITFTYPDNMKLVSIGKHTELGAKERSKSSRWVMGRRVRNASFHVGLFREMELETGPGTPKTRMLYITKDQAEVVATDIAQSLKFYTTLFGELPVDELVASELPSNHGEAFPGLVHLSSYAFFKDNDNVKNDDFFGEQFTSHEVAHQWWGIAVDFADPRDRWLSEGFAEYSCLLYSQLAAKEGDKFFRLLDEYSKEIRDFGKRTAGKDLPPPAIALGPRVGAGSLSSATNTFTYYKSAWVLHMLRNMMLDLNTMKEDAFMTVMKQYYSDFKNKHASTADFNNTIKKVTGVELQWFFDQWVFGNQIPTYTVAWKKEQTPDGKWKVTLRVRQTEVAESFKMFVPLKVVLDDNKVSRMRLLMTGKELVTELPLFSSEPDDVEFNDLHSVLCNVDTESF